jgi:thiol-disulfide isomerase/thioredoxin
LLPASERRAELGLLVAYLNQRPLLGREDLTVMGQIGERLTESGSADLAAEAYASFAEMAIQRGQNAIAGRLQGIARRVALPGHVMSLGGRTLSDQPFDLNDLSGKVVLVDFFALWCSACRSEIPTLVGHYARLHGRGLEIVGVSLEDERAELGAFSRGAEVTWTIIVRAEGPNRVTATEYYGIDAIPVGILIGRDGKVISTAARGLELNRLLDIEFPR